MLSPRISARQRLGLTAQMRGQLRILALSTDLLAEEIAVESADNPFLSVEMPPASLPPGWDGTLDTAAAQDGLVERLSRQIGLQRLDAATEAVALYLVGELREDGYLDSPLDELAAQTGVPLALFEAGLSAIQRCEPSGVGARDLAECLALQLADHDIAPDLARRLCAHLDDLAEGRLARVARAVGIEVAEVQRLGAILRGLSPAPILPEDSQPLQTRIPELIVETSRSGTITVAMNPAALPRIRQLPLPRRAAGNPAIDALHQRAGWLVAALAARQATLLRIGRIIAERQARFFLGGQASLVPDSRTAIARDLGLHPSTLGRAVAGKALAADGRVHPLSIFFSRSLPGPGGHVSAFDIQLRMRALISAEDSARPLADDDICTKLKDEGVDIARRTVAKYRKCMRIPSSYERRRRQVSPETRPSAMRDPASSRD